MQALQIQPKSQTLMSTIFHDAEKRRRNMVYYTAKKVSGRQLATVHKKNNIEFDWEAFNKEFDNQYSEWSTEALIQELIANVYYIYSESDICNLYFRYQAESNNNQKSNSNTQNGLVLQFAKK